jgi:hypothetical protein
MNPIHLNFSTGNQQIDHAIQGIVGIFEAAFPQRIRSYYLVGSYVDGSATPFSDIDIRVIFKDDFEAGEEERMLRIRNNCRLISPIAIDCPPLSEARLLHDENWLHEPLGIKSDGRLLFGEEIRHAFSEPDFDAYVRNVTAVPVNRFSRIRNQSPLIFPLDYPDPEGDFYGYDDTSGPDWAKIQGTKNLVHMLGFAATCLIAIQARRIVTRKSDWLKIYKETINDQWTPLLENIYLQCKELWLYCIPENEVERGQLREFCRQTLAFENYYLTCYHAFLFNELQSGDNARQHFAIERLKEIVYPNQ